MVLTEEADIVAVPLPVTSGNICAGVLMLLLAVVEGDGAGFAAFWMMLACAA